jgi:hypothetical protein
MMTVDLAEWRIVEQTSDLRFVERDGNRILQQRYFWLTKNDSGNEWQDVPLVSEDD